MNESYLRSTPDPCGENDFVHGVLWDENLKYETIESGIRDYSLDSSFPSLHFVPKYCRTLVEDENVEYGKIMDPMELESEQLLWMKFLFKELTKIGPSCLWDQGVDLLNAIFYEVFFDLKGTYALTQSLAYWEQRKGINNWIIHTETMRIELERGLVQWGKSRGYDLKIVQNHPRKWSDEILKRVQLALYKFKGTLSNYAPGNSLQNSPSGGLTFLGYDNYLNGSRHVVPILNYIHKVLGRDVHYLTGKKEVLDLLIQSDSLNGSITFDGRLEGAAGWFGKRPAGLLRALDQLPESVWQVRESDFSHPLKEAVLHFLGKRLSSAASMARRLKGHFVELRPCVVVSGSSGDTGSRILENLAKNHQISSCCVQHGLFTKSPLVSTLQADLYCVWGEGFREMLEEGLRPDQDVVTTGSCFHESDEAEDGLTIEISSDPDILLFAPSRIGGSYVSEGESIKALRTIGEHASEHPNIKWVIKLHPADYRRSVDQWLKIIPKNLQIAREGGVESLIRRARAVVVQTSTVSFETILQGKPLVVLWTEIDRRFPFMHDGSARLARDGNELKSILDSILIKGSERDASGSKGENEIKEKSFSGGVESAVKSASEAIVRSVETYVG